jgi:hypothetical protein
VRRTLGWIAGALGLAGAYGALKRHRQALPAGPDPRAEELRRKLAEAQPPPDPLPAPPQPEPVPDPAPEPQDPEARRRAVHERARAAVDEMQRED